MFWVNFETLSVTLILEEIASYNPFLAVVVGDFNLKHNKWWDIKGRAWGSWTLKTEPSSNDYNRPWKELLLSQSL